MADYIDRQASIDVIDEVMQSFFCGAEDNDVISDTEKLMLTINKVICEKKIKALPSADVQPVVRCKDCKYYYYAENRIPSERGWACANDGCYASQNDYCSWGERIDG